MVKDSYVYFQDTVQTPATSNLFADASYTFASSGDGNLTINSWGNSDTPEGKTTFNVSYAFNNYLPIFTSISLNRTATLSSMSTSVDVEMSNSFNWGVCNPIYMNLADYSSAK